MKQLLSLAALVLCLNANAQFGLEPITYYLDHHFDNVQSEEEFLRIADSLADALPNNATPRYYQFYGLVDVGRTQDAMILLNNSIKTFPDSLFLRYERAHVYFENNYLRYAQEDFEYLDIHDLSGLWFESNVYSYLGTIYVAQGKPDLALEYGFRTYYLDTTAISGLNNLSTLFDEMGNSDSAMYYLEKAIELYPDIKLLHSNRGFFLQKLGRHDEAIEEFEISFETDTVFGYSFVNAAFSQYNLGRYEEALENVERGLAVESTNAYGYAVKAQILIKLDRVDEACLAIGYGLRYGYTERFGSLLNELAVKHCEREEDKPESTGRNGK